MIVSAKFPNVHQTLRNYNAVREERESQLPDIRNLAKWEIKEKYPHLIFTEEIKVNGFMYPQAKNFVREYDSLLEQPITLFPKRWTFPDGVETESACCHMNTRSLIHFYGGTQRLSYILRRVKRTLIVSMSEVLELFAKELDR